MGHYDNCRPENCPGCGQAKGVVWACGRRYCSTYHTWLQRNNKKEYKKLMAELRAENKAAEKKCVTRQQIKRQTAQIAAKAKAEAEK